MGVDALYKRAKAVDKTLKRKDVVEWYKKQSVNQVFKRTQKPTVFRAITCPYLTGSCVQADLLDVSNYKGTNRGIRFLLNVVDIYSRLPGHSL